MQGQELQEGRGYVCVLMAQDRFPPRTHNCSRGRRHGCNGKAAAPPCMRPREWGHTDIHGKKLAHKIVFGWTKKHHSLFPVLSGLV